ncbi:MAG: lipoate--protein ligase family protein [Limnothrix sp. CACIAM 69d]|nr:MAG: lipoate--protein ligase family protein [Limnothrix sp. CACIAM 69d]
MGDRWRLIPTLNESGAVQMAIDRWLFEQHVQAAGPPVLRFYTWSEPTISLGFHQRRYPAAWEQLQWADRPVPLVRRPTGGRAVLHGNDLTYAVIGSQFGSRRDAYCRICQFLIAGWQALGVELRFGEGRSVGLRNQANCFALATDADLVLADGGEKLIGSAQYLRGAAVLQHGSIALHPHRSLHGQIFGTEPPEPRLPPLSRSHLVATLTQAARDTFSIELEEEPLSDREWAAIRALAQEQGWPDRLSVDRC